MKKITNNTSSPVGFRMHGTGMVLGPKASITVDESAVNGNKSLDGLVKTKKLKIAQV